MHEQGRYLINKAIKRKKITGIDEKCEYFPCHNGLEDCTFCYCPFYPCYQKDTGGFEKVSSRTSKSVWACSSCIFPHKVKNAKEILIGLIELGINIDLISKDKLMELHSKILKKNGD